MLFFFVDDSKQKSPRRQRMGPLVAAGAVAIPAANVKRLERQLAKLCKDTGFPDNAPFKWSPGRELWMWKGLTHQARGDFFRNVLALAAGASVKVMVVIEDTGCKSTSFGVSHEMDVVRILIERINMYAKDNNCDAVIIADRPSGDRKTEEEFLLECLETLQNGTEYVKPDRICVNVLSAPSKFLRILQLADLVTGCTVAYFSGEETHSKAIFDTIKPLFRSFNNQIGGIGVKLHPDFKYVNLYHWLLGDAHYGRVGAKAELPLMDKPYGKRPDRYVSLTIGNFTG